MSQTEQNRFSLGSKDQIRRLVRSYCRDRVLSYASQRNYDLGPDNHRHVSCLSPYVSRGVIAEDEIVAEVLTHHGFLEVQKFVEEVCWRTYWRGWLRQHPQVWESYTKRLAVLQDQSEQDSTYAAAIKGETSIDCFNHWVRELKETGYVHNHGRMWFASIWIHTFKLPWQLGAQFFLDHLLDADPAANTLSWRWVAGLHTKGKQYLARPDNIRKFTGGRFSPKGLADRALEPEDDDANGPLIPLDPMTKPDSQHDHWIVLPDDWTLDRYLADRPARSIAMVDPKLFDPNACDLKKEFVRPLFEDATMRHQQVCEAITVIKSWDDFAGFVGEKDQVAYMRPDIGPINDMFCRKTETVKNVQWTKYTRPWDQKLFSHCGRGFFQLKKRIPSLLNID